MKIKMGEKVLTEKGKNVGEIKRVVMDPRTDEISHVVIEKGMLFTEERVVPIGMLGAKSDEGVTLRASQEEIEMLPRFESKHFLLYSDLNEAMKEQKGYATPLIMYPPAGLMRAGAPYPTYPPLVRHVDENIPEESVAISEGADVIGLEGEKVGDIEQVFTDPKLDRATYFLISKGLLLKERKLIPVEWVQETTEDKIRLAVNTKIVQQLPDYPEGVPEKE